MENNRTMYPSNSFYPSNFLFSGVSLYKESIKIKLSANAT